MSTTSRRALVVGASGLVGAALMRELPNAVGTYRSRPVRGLLPLDAGDADALRRLVDDAGAIAIYFPAAQPNVEWCEIHPDEAEAENIAPLRTALAVARERGLPLLAYSTDYVFDGADGPYDEDHPRRPMSAYGRIKARLEDLVLEAGGVVVRTTGVFGREPGEPRNFVLRLVASLARGEVARIPDDQWSNPTYADDVATASRLLVESGESGVWHVAGPDYVSRVELARHAAAAFRVSGDGIVPTPTRELAQRAARPLRGGLRTEKVRARFGELHRPLDRALADLAALSAS